jgi:nucleoside-diphosphate-sugar epimerase
MRILVTGGGGILGSWIARKLHERGEQVMVLRRRKYAHLDSGIESIACDIHDKEGISSVLEGCDAVFHSASIEKFVRSIQLDPTNSSAFLSN